MSSLVTVQVFNRQPLEGPSHRRRNHRPRRKLQRLDPTFAGRVGARSQGIGGATVAAVPLMKSGKSATDFVPPSSFTMVLTTFRR